jgi:hypothetical protein
MLEELLEKYKEYAPIVNYFNKDCYDCVSHNHPIGWHCSLAIEKIPNPYDEELYFKHKRIHTSGHKTALEALQTAIINMLESKQDK